MLGLHGNSGRLPKLRLREPSCGRHSRGYLSPTFQDAEQPAKSDSLDAESKACSGDCNPEKKVTSMFVTDSEVPATGQWHTHYLSHLSGASQLSPSLWAVNSCWRAVITASAIHWHALMPHGRSSSLLS